MGAELTSRLTDLAVVDACVDRETSSVDTHMGWVPHSLGAGYAGIALALAENAAALGDAELAERASGAVLTCMQKIARATAEHPVEGAGLFSGTSGLGYVLDRLVATEPRFSRMADATHAALLEQHESLVPARPDSGVSFLEYDLIEGAAGVLLHLVSSARADAGTVTAVDGLVDYLLWLVAEPDEVGGLPRWFTPPEAYPTPRYLETFPHGLLNLGLSHGLPGVLVALAQVLRSGHREGEVRRAVERTTELLDAARTGAGWDWAIDPRAEHPGVTRQDAPDAWCYGTPGVCLALRHAGEALGSAELTREADRTFESMIARHQAGPSSLSPTVCHGDAGLVLLTDHFASRGNAAAAEWVQQQAQVLVSKTSTVLPLGVQDHENGGHLVDDPSLLTGSAGVARVLVHLAAGSTPGSFLPFVGE